MRRGSTSEMQQTLKADADKQKLLQAIRSIMQYELATHTPSAALDRVINKIAKLDYEGYFKKCIRIIDSKDSDDKKLKKLVTLATNITKGYEPLVQNIFHAIIDDAQSKLPFEKTRIYSLLKNKLPEIIAYNEAKEQMTSNAKGPPRQAASDPVYSKDRPAATSVSGREPPRRAATDPVYARDRARATVISPRSGPAKATKEDAFSILRDIVDIYISMNKPNAKDFEAYIDILKKNPDHYDEIANLLIKQASYRRNKSDRISDHLHQLICDIDRTDPIYMNKIKNYRVHLQAEYKKTHPQEAEVKTRRSP